MGRNHAINLGTDRFHFQHIAGAEALLRYKKPLDSPPMSKYSIPKTVLDRLSC